MVSAAHSQETGVLRFGPFRFDPATGELRRNGAIVSLRPKATAILAALIEAEGQLVSREALIERAWPDTILEQEAALHTAIKQIRRALNDSASQPAYIETVHRRGYRFASQLSGSETEPAVVGIVARRRINGAVLAAVSVIIAIAVWAAQSPASSNEEDDDPAVDRASYLLSRGSDADVRSAVALLEPLTAAGTQSARIWSSLGAAYSRLQRFDDAESMARRSLELDDHSPEAHRVLAESAMMYRQDFDLAQRLYLRALALDPNDADSHGGYAFLLLLTGSIDESIREVRRALTLEPLSTLINGDAALILYWAGRYGEAESQAVRTLEIEPRYVPALDCLRLVHLVRGNLDGARDASVRILQALHQPDSVITSATTGPASHGLEAFREWKIKRTASQLTNDSPNTWIWHGLALAEAGRVNESRLAIARAEELRASMLPIFRLDARSKLPSSPF